MSKSIISDAIALSPYNTVLIASCLLYQYLSKGNYPEIATYLMAAATGFLCLIKIILDRGTIQQSLKSSTFLLKFTICFIFSLVYFFCQNRLDLLMYLLLSIAIIDVGAEKFFTYAGLLSTLFFGLHLALYTTGQIKDHIQVESRATDDGMLTRYSLGFDHPNFATCFILIILAAGIYSRVKKHRLFFITVSLIYSLITYDYTNSRTALVTVLAGIILLGFIGHKINTQLLYILVIFSLFLGFIITTAMAFLFHANGPINFLFSQRPRAMYQLLQSPTPLLGNTLVKEQYEQGGSIDNFYFHLLYAYGAIITIVIIALFIFLAQTAKNRKNKGICLVILLYLLYGLTENHVLDYGFSVIAPLLFMPFFNKNFFESQQIPSRHLSTHN